MYKDEIVSLCRELRLCSLLGDYETIEANSHEEFLYKVLLELRKNRQVSRVNRSMKQAGFDVIKLFEDFDFSDVVLPASLTIDSLRLCAPFQRKENLILYGRPGTGKTHLATALGINAVKQGMKVLFRKTSKLVNELKEERNHQKSAGFLKKLEAADILILDERGYIPFERMGTQLLFEAVSSCYEKKSIVITTNLPFDEWNTIFYDEKLTTAILDRVVHHGHFIHHNGQSYRIRHSMMK